MQKILCLILFSLVLITGCERGTSNHSPLTGNKPPGVQIKIADQFYDTKLGTYCWSSNNMGVCVDTAGPVEHLEDVTPLKVSPEATIQFVMNYEPKPNQFSLQQYSGVNIHKKVSIENNAFTAPTQEGTYYYSYGAWWMDEENEQVSHGDAFYHFVIEVEK
ncbi:hypothetical protein PUW24_21930 [Paenibacillus urinalis]|uniref:Lipoprotein n=1 Tax=Paenibacillus urinalis TaxID=521520 RepID=A0AAX3MTH4_9BACL|nr:MULTISPECIES: hypothetical protein [Paenibacillus]WDH80726.1 hypothetical protein PUW23_14335 [Paenibacillus urinalis]WDH96779.1 hypothetical protein PUW24_21930 [Paenibacillus urinalis]WDI00422.1 hypothetical protein PUW25_14080 [Paenibacillus urinalis]GAK39096.1 hypothetical protein TCA2_1584 [Paenibacillus sp. TCA20]